MRGKPGSASMSDQHDYVALEWVKDEIADTLRQARQALDGLDEPEHAGQNIAECLACIHQVHGSLQMVEFYGAALLAEEMEQLVLAMQEGRVSEPAEAVSLLHRPSCRGCCASGDRCCRPRWSGCCVSRTTPPTWATWPRYSAASKGCARALRWRRFGRSVRRWSKACSRAQSATARRCALLKDADKELKRLLEQGIEGINQPAPEELLKSLLFYIAKAEHPTAQMLVLKARYGLDDALPETAVVDEERARLAGPDRDAMRSVVSALCEELVRVKERLDLFVRSDRLHTDDLGSLLAPLRQIADTLAVLGFGQPRKVIIDQLAVVQGLAQGQREPNDAVLMDVAGALLYVEATLAGMVGTVEPQSREENRLPTTDLTLIHQIVIKEALLCLQQVKDLIVDYIDADWDRERLAPLPDLLTQVRGALSMIPLGRAASLLETCNHCIREQLIDGPTAPSLSGIEYYLERLAEDHEALGEQVLDKVEQSLDALGYLPVELEVPLLEEVLSPTEALVMRDLQALDDPHVVQSLADVLANPTRRPGKCPAACCRRRLTRRRSMTSCAKCFSRKPLRSSMPCATTCRAGSPILKASRHHRDLHSFPTQRSSDLEGKSALGELRRAFHTLKGSGRMVRALVLAELAWAMENLLNRVLERSLEPGPEVPQLIEEVVRLLPELVAEFAADAQRQRDDVDQLAARAHALANVAGEQEAEDWVEGLDLQLLEIFRNEAESHLDSLNRFLEQAAEHLPLQVSDELQRALHTLKGSAYMAGVLPGRSTTWCASSRPISWRWTWTRSSCCSRPKGCFARACSNWWMIR